MKETLKKTEQTKIKHQASHGQLKWVNLTTNCSLVILEKDERPLSIREEHYVSVSQRNGMEWPGSKPNKSHLPRITHEGEVCCSARLRAAVMSTGRTACFYRLPLDRWQHCSPSLFFCFVLEEVRTRGE